MFDAIFTAPVSLPIFTTSLLSRALDLAKDAVLLDCLGLIVGPNGTGKTEALRSILNRYPSLGLPGICHYHRACATQGPTRGVKDLLYEFGIREAHVSSTNLQIACKLGLRELSNRKVSLLLLDEADTLAKDSLGGMITFVDYCHQHGNKLGLIMAAAQDVGAWFRSQPAGISRTIRCERSQNLTAEESLAVLKDWVPGLASLVEDAKAEKLPALKLARLIHKGTGDGNFRRLTYFAKLLLTEPSCDEAAIKAVLQKILTVG